MTSQYDLYGGIPPYEKTSDTSKAAAVSVAEHAITLQQCVLAHVRFAGDWGITCDEIEQKMAGRHQTISARVRELVLLGHIRDSGCRRKTRSGRNARIYIACNRSDPSPIDERDSFTSVDYQRARDGE